jgi:hypothetical protein
MGAQARPFGLIRVGRAEELDASRSLQAPSNAKLKWNTEFKSFKAPLMDGSSCT